MKNLNCIYVVITALLFAATGCDDNQSATPVPATGPSALSANFIFANAMVTSSASLQLDLLINEVKAGNAVEIGQGQTGGYINVPITSNGTFANTTIQAIGDVSPIGGVLGSGKLYYRSANNGSNGLTATNGFYYTVIAVDSVSRPAPARKLNAGNFGDTTFFNIATGQYISTVDRKALTASQKQQLVAIGTVPLGSTDPGGIRFLVFQDNQPTFANGNTTQSAIRFVNAVPNSYALVSSGSNYPSYPAADRKLYAKLVPSAGSSVTLSSGSTYALAFSAGLNPSVGSRTATGSTFSMQTTVPGGVATTYDLVVDTNASYTNPVTLLLAQTFEANKIYTVVVSGVIGATDSRALKAGIIQHN